jgi:hypothetical protein
MLIRKASAPDCISLRTMSGVLDAGPSVAKIFTLRDRGLRDSLTMRSFAASGGEARQLKDANSRWM